MADGNGKISRGFHCLPWGQWSFRCEKVYLLLIASEKVSTVMPAYLMAFLSVPKASSR